jgi:hypothetical protein
VTGPLKSTCPFKGINATKSCDEVMPFLSIVEECRAVVCVACGGVENGPSYRRDLVVKIRGVVVVDFN